MLCEKHIDLKLCSPLWGNKSILSSSSPCLSSRPIEPLPKKDAMPMMRRPDEWKDPWRRSKSPRRRQPMGSPPRGRRRHRPSGSSVSMSHSSRWAREWARAAHVENVSRAAWHHGGGRGVVCVSFYFIFRTGTMHNETLILHNKKICIVAGFSRLLFSACSPWAGWWYSAQNIITVEVKLQ